ncbi:hypothetical protein WICPIJ_006884 [Wickerhamomyces pijperi]|uniref:Uncharacterized protein n=1 Tax=Wickerhamomyces pijperi TaxID=599730 RepID=A0A9P8Q2Q1_WICPI|nr:hypothetical protein WICPIJ_006884 [Wickerhamomyces pijperi]
MAPPMEVNFGKKLMLSMLLLLTTIKPPPTSSMLLNSTSFKLAFPIKLKVPPTFLNFGNFKDWNWLLISSMEALTFSTLDKFKELTSLMVMLLAYSNSGKLTVTPLAFALMANFS